MARTKLMEEVFFYLTTDVSRNRTLFMRGRLAQPFRGRIFLLADPLLDERDKVSRFMTSAACALCKEGSHAFQFDYYGTGDSAGESHEFDCEETVGDMDLICKYLCARYAVADVKLLGVRWGADLALRYAQTSTIVQQLYLIEPVIHGRRYLTEQQLRRDAFRRLNHVLAEDRLKMEGQEYLDHQGYLLSARTLHYLERWGTDQIHLKGKVVFLFKLNTVFSAKVIGSLRATLTPGNTLHYREVNCPDFWANLELADTTKLTCALVAATSESARPQGVVK